MSNTINYPKLDGTLIDHYSTKQLGKLAGLSDHMVNYLCRYDLLRPSVSCPGCRGARRSFSFSDVIFARAIAKILKAGVSVVALRKALTTLNTKLQKIAPSAILGKRVVIVGNSVYLLDSDEPLVDLTANGQLAFHFVLDIPKIPSRVHVGARKRRLTV